MRVTIAHYNRQWPASFALIKASLQEILQLVPILAIENVGSTSVPGLAAKPVLDIDVVVMGTSIPLAIAALEKSMGFRTDILIYWMEFSCRAIRKFLLLHLSATTIPEA